MGEESHLKQLLQHMISTKYDDVDFMSITSILVIRHALYAVHMNISYAHRLAGMYDVHAHDWQFCKTQAGLSGIC